MDKKPKRETQKASVLLILEKRINDYEIARGKESFEFNELREILYGNVIVDGEEEEKEESEESKLQKRN